MYGTTGGCSTFLNMKLCNSRPDTCFCSRTTTQTERGSWWHPTRSGNATRCCEAVLAEQPTDKFRGESEDKDDPTLLIPYSYLVQFGKVNDRLHLIPLRNLVGTTIVIENIQKHKPTHEPTTPKEISERERLDNLIDPLGRGFFVVRPRRSWAGFFENLIESYSSPPNQRGRRSNSSVDPT